MDSSKMKSVSIISPLGVEMMTMEKFECEGERLAIHGAFMGSVLVKMYVNPEDVLRMIGLFFKPQVIGYLIQLPLILFRKKFNSTKE